MYGRSRNPRRNAFEYGVLVSLAAGMTCAYGVMIYISMTPGPDGKRRDLKKVDLNAPVNLREMWLAMTTGTTTGNNTGNGWSAILGGTAGSSNPTTANGVNQSTKKP